MPKKRKKSENKWLNNIKQKVAVGQSKTHPYNPTYIPWALDNRKKFYCDAKSHSFKDQGALGLLLLERARVALKEGAYPE